MMKCLILITSSLAIFLSACQKEITIAQPDYTEKTSIQGILEPDSFPIVYLNRSTPFLGKPTSTSALVIRNALVKISDNEASELLQLDSTYDKIYCQYDYFYKGSIKSKWNTSYTLEIESRGQLFSATTTTVLKQVSIDSVSYTKAFNDVYGEHEGVITYFKDTRGAEDFYRYEQYRTVDTSMKHASIKLQFSNTCIGKDTVGILELGRSVYTDTNQDGQQLKIVVEPAYTHRKGLVTKVKIQTINKDMHDFYDQIDKQKLGQYNPFVEPSFLREGQFGSKAIGFFGSMTRSKGVTFVFPE
jgi:hypothetical protein